MSSTLLRAGVGTEARPTRLLVVDADADFRSRTVALLDAAGYAAASSTSGEEAIEASRAAGPALAIVSASLPGISGYELCQALKDRFGADLSVMMVEERGRALDPDAGPTTCVDGYIEKPVAPEALLASVRQLLGRTSVSGDSRELADLTDREREILRLLALGTARREIAARLEISPSTVRSHVEHIFAKLGVHSQLQAVAWAYKKGLL